MPFYTKAQINLSCYEEASCNLCDILVFATNLVRWMLGIGGSVALFFFILGGFYFIIGGSHPERLESAKNILKNSIIGLLIILLAWSGINYMVYLFTNTKIDSVATILGEPWPEFTCQVYQVAPIAGEEGEEGVLTLTNLKLGGINPIQLDYTSEALDKALKELDEKLKSGEVKISSLSDDNIFDGTCYRTGGVCTSACQHNPEDCDSKHYGADTRDFNKNNPPESCAADFTTDQENYDDLEDEAEKSFDYVQCEDKDGKEVDCNSGKVNHLHASAEGSGC